MPRHNQANRADEKDLAGLTLNPEVEGLKVKYEIVNSATSIGLNRAKRR